MNLDSPVDDATKSVGYKVLGHRHFGLEVFLVVDHSLNALLHSEDRAVAEPIEGTSTIMSSAISAWAIHRMQWANRAGPSRYCPSR